MGVVPLNATDDSSIRWFDMPEASNWKCKQHPLMGVFYSVPTPCGVHSDVYLPIICVGCILMESSSAHAYPLRDAKSQ